MAVDLFSEFSQIFSKKVNKQVDAVVIGEKQSRRGDRNAWNTLLKSVLSAASQLTERMKGDSLSLPQLNLTKWC